MFFGIMFSVVSFSSFCMHEQEKEIRARRAEQYKAHLQAEFQSAMRQKDMGWLTGHRELLIRNRIVTEEQFDEIIEGSQEAARREEQRTAQAEEDKQVFKDVALERMKKAASCQIMIEQGLSWLYSVLNKKDEYYDQLMAIAKLTNLEEIYGELTKLTENPVIMAFIGDELNKLRGYMLYREWSNPSAMSDDDALCVFERAVARQDINAMVLLAEQGLKHRKGQEIITAVIPGFMAAIKQEKIDMAVDLYLHFFKGTGDQDVALNMLDRYKTTMVERRDIAGLKKLSICFHGTDQEAELKSLITALELEQGQEPSYDHDAPDAVPGAMLWDLYRGALANYDIATLNQFRTQFLRNGIVESEEIFDTIVASLAQHEHDHSGASTSVPAPSAVVPTAHAQGSLFGQRMPFGVSGVRQVGSPDRLVETVAPQPITREPIHQPVVDQAAHSTAYAPSLAAASQSQLVMPAADVQPAPSLIQRVATAPVRFINEHRVATSVALGATLLAAALRHFRR
jgi:hypothetical protein